MSRQAASVELDGFDQSGQSPPSPGELLTPDVVAWSLLGEGPYCMTWAGWSLSRWCPVAVKLPLVDAETAPALRALEREASALRRLDHPGLARLLVAALDADVSAEPNGRRWPPHLVLELVEGRPLSVMIDKSPFKAGDTIRLGLQLTAALGYLHQLGIAHLDVKPANVMIRMGRATIIDFGAAVPLGVGAPRGPRGTDGYMSAEEAAGEPATVAMDLYSLGAVLYECLTGERAADRGNRGDRGDRAVRWRAAWRWRRAPARLRALIDALLSPLPQDRPAGAPVVLAALSALEGPPARGWAPAIARPYVALLEERGRRAPTRDDRATTLATTPNPSQSERATTPASRALSR